MVSNISGKLSKAFASGYFSAISFRRSRSTSQIATMFAPCAEPPMSDSPLPMAPMPATLIFLPPPSCEIRMFGTKMLPVAAAVLRRKERRLGWYGFMAGLGESVTRSRWGRGFQEQTSSFSQGRPRRCMTEWERTDVLAHGATCRGLRAHQLEFYRSGGVTFCAIPCMNAAVDLHSIPSDPAAMPPSAATADCLGTETQTLA
jgi:hypothetical protein